MSDKEEKASKPKVLPRPVTARSKQLYINLYDLINNRLEFLPVLTACMLDDTPVDCVSAIRMMATADGKIMQEVFPVAILVNKDLMGRLKNDKGEDAQPVFTPEQEQKLEQVLEKIHGGSATPKGEGSA